MHLGALWDTVCTKLEGGRIYVQVVCEQHVDCALAVSLSLCFLLSVLCYSYSALLQF